VKEQFTVLRDKVSIAQTIQFNLFKILIFIYVVLFISSLHFLFDWQRIHATLYKSCCSFLYTC